MTRRLTASLCLAGTLSLTACGTTVPLTSSRAASSDGVAAGLGQTGTANATAPGEAVLPGASTTGSGSATTTARSGSTTTRSSGVTNGTTSTGSSDADPTTGAVNARGVTAKAISIGIAIATGSQSVANSFGISGGGTVAEQDVWNAVIHDVNATGGVLGRKLDLYTHSVDLAAYVANPEQTIAEVCSDFRDDHHVFSALISISDPALRSCMAKMGTPLVVYDSTVGAIVPAKAYSEYGGNYLYVPNGITMERLAELFVKSLVARSFTQKWDTTNGRPGLAPVKLGLIHADTPDQNILYAAYAKELARYGLKFDDTVTYSGDVSTALASTQSAVLKFSSEGITHVFGASAFFLRYAESQHYRPRYAYLPALGAFGAANSPAAQMAGAMTVGWSPTVDVNAAQDPGPNPGVAHCQKVMKAAGLQAANREDEKLMYAVCDAVYSFRAALTAGRTPTVPGLRRGFEALGSSFPTAQSFGSFLAPNHHYGIDSVRDVAYDTACSCLKYTSKTNRS